MIVKPIFLCLALSNFAVCSEWTYLIDKDLTQWEVFSGIPNKELKMEGYIGDYDHKSATDKEPLGLGKDPLGVFTVTEEQGKPILRVSGQMLSSLVTKKDFSNYHLSLEMKWGDEKMSWADNWKDSGVVSHSFSPHGGFWKAYMRGVECSLDNYHIDRFYGLGNVKASTFLEEKTDGQFHYSPNGNYQTIQGFGQSKHSALDTSKEWNRLEIFTILDKMVFVTNGIPAIAIFELRIETEPGTSRPLTEGKIQILSQGSEIFFRNVKIRSIDAFPAELASMTESPKDR